jgi:hypothetical protein
MASRNPSSKKPSQGGRATQQKQRSTGDRERARASGGGLRNEPVQEPAGRSASTGGRANKASLHNDMNSRSCNAGGQGRRRVPKQP